MTILRRAEPGDEDAIAKVHVRSWQAAYRGLLPDSYLDTLDPGERAALYTFGEQGPDRPITIAAVIEGVIYGFATTGRCRDADAPNAGELYAIYVDPEWWGRGVGQLLIADVRRHLTSLGHNEVVLWVLVGNERAERFYTRDGWSSDGRRRREDVHGISVEETQYHRLLP